MSYFLPISDRNLILTGYTGPNQPLIGRQAAERLRMPFVNIDRQIEDRVGLTIEDLRQNYGESRLKTLETEIMAEAVLRRSTLIQVSGRTLLNGSYLKGLQQTGEVICLVATLDAILQRLHLNLGARYHDPQERALALGYLKREWAVRTLPGIHEIDVTYMTEADIIETVASIWQQLAIVRS